MEKCSVFGIAVRWTSTSVSRDIAQENGLAVHEKESTAASPPGFAAARTSPSVAAVLSPLFCLAMGSEGGAQEHDGEVRCLWSARLPAERRVRLPTPALCWRMAAR
jgi:hypothetical protein